ncbi:MAG: cbb3-type cytochrome c oxidase subunit I [Cyclobacteriaceae bacterium]|nr:cbb3-type cytochrome c oxidase subunit I [Cyclobacteriaceae bacterium]
MLIQQPSTISADEVKLPPSKPARTFPPSKAGTLFLTSGIVSLLFGMLFGLLGSVQYLLPDFLAEAIPFFKTRPLHVSLVIAWIFQGAAGSIYCYAPASVKRPLFSEALARVHWILFVVTGLGIVASYAFRHFGGREYLEYPIWFAIPITLSWCLIIVNYFKTIKESLSKYPVYIWMWGTGIIAFLVTYLESYLWLFNSVQSNTVRDITIQWKANGAMVGSWNQMVYGTAFYLMERISGNKDTSRSRLTFFFYFLGLTNLLFNWGHHTYIVPSATWIKNVAYIISMTELLILGNIIWNWRKTLTDAQRHFHVVPYRLLLASDVWIFLNLALSILISIPAVNFYTHGTHITVAHAMGATIGINTLILLASAYFLAITIYQKSVTSKLFNVGYWLTNISLLVFWISLLGAGIVKSLQAKHPFSIDPYEKYLEQSLIWFRAFSYSGFALLIGLSILSVPLLRIFINKIRARSN